MALESDILKLLAKILKSQLIKGVSSLQIFIYIKFALRCLTSAIRTEPAVNRVRFFALSNLILVLSN